MSESADTRGTRDRDRPRDMRRRCCVCQCPLRRQEGAYCDTCQLVLDRIAHLHGAVQIRSMPVEAQEARTARVEAHAERVAREEAEWLAAHPHRHRRKGDLACQRDPGHLEEGLEGEQ